MGDEKNIKTIQLEMSQSTMSATGFELTKRMIQTAVENGLLADALANKGLAVAGNPVIKMAGNTITLAIAVYEGNENKIGEAIFGGLGAITGACLV